MTSTASKQDDIDVRLVDQEKINEFGKLNNRLLELRADIKQYKLDAEKLEDATSDLALDGDGSNVMIMIGESFVEVTAEYAEEYCEKKSEALKKRIEAYTQEEQVILKKQEVLKKELYSRFGDTINLES